MLQELVVQECYTRPKVECDATGLLMRGVWPYAPYKFDFLFQMLLFISDRSLDIINWSFLWFWKSIPHGKKSIPHGQKAYYGHVVCPYIPHDTYQMLYHVVCQQPWYNGIETTFSGVGPKEWYFKNIRLRYLHQPCLFLIRNLAELVILAIHPEKQKWENKTELGIFKPRKSWFCIRWIWTYMKRWQELWP